MARTDALVKKTRFLMAVDNTRITNMLAALDVRNPLSIMRS
jgi:hypothetical protein